MVYGDITIYRDGVVVGAGVVVVLTLLVRTERMVMNTNTENICSSD